jgi:ABC-type bacteriocin/lantibiotic exporter with double-glycine peptidase domain
MRAGIAANMGNALVDATMSFVLIVIGLVYAWKLALLMLAVLPIISGCGALMFIKTTKSKQLELKAYENAGQIVQSVFSSIKTITAFSLQKRFSEMYKNNLKETQIIMSKKGLLFGFFNGAIESMLIVILGVCILFATYLGQTDCETTSFSNIMVCVVCIILSFSYLGNALAFLNTLSQGLFFNLLFFNFLFNFVLIFFWEQLKWLPKAFSRLLTTSRILTRQRTMASGWDNLMATLSCSRSRLAIHSVQIA